MTKSPGKKNPDPKPQMNIQHKHLTEGYGGYDWINHPNVHFGGSSMVSSISWCCKNMAIEHPHSVHWKWSGSSDHLPKQQETPNHQQSSLSSPLVYTPWNYVIAIFSVFFSTIEYDYCIYLNLYKIFIYYILLLIIWCIIPSYFILTNIHTPFVCWWSFTMGFLLNNHRAVFKSSTSSSTKRVEGGWRIALALENFMGILGYIPPPMPTTPKKKGIISFFYGGNNDG